MKLENGIVSVFINAALRNFSLEGSRRLLGAFCSLLGLFRDAFLFFSLFGVSKWLESTGLGKASRGSEESAVPASLSSSRASVCSLLQTSTASRLFSFLCLSSWNEWRCWRAVSRAAVCSEWLLLSCPSSLLMLSSILFSPFNMFSRSQRLFRRS